MAKFVPYSDLRDALCGDPIGPPIWVAVECGRDSDYGRAWWSDSNNDILVTWSGSRETTPLADEPVWVAFDEDEAQEIAARAYRLAKAADRETMGGA